MAINWNFNANDVEEDFPLIPEGDHRVRIASAEETTSSGGNDMVKMSMDVSGYPGKIFYYLVFMENNSTMTNTNLKRLFDSFGIAPGNMNVSSWVGKVGAAKIKHREYNGEKQASIQYFLSQAKQENLPGWVEKSQKPPAFSSAQPFGADDFPF